MRRRSFVPLCLLILAIPVAAATTFREVDIRILPPQPVKAISIRGGEETRSVAVRNGKALIPSDLPAPWSLQMVRFEADVYTPADLDAKRPWVIRELGTVRGRMERRRPAQDERYTWLLAKGKSEEVREADFTLDGQGAFEIRLAAGMYQGAVLGPGCGTRIRSGIVVKPGETTDLGTIVAEPAAPVSVRVLDAGGRGGVAGAHLIWDPAGDMLNSVLSRRLFARRWSTVTDARGMAQINAIGPVPHSARWRIEAKGFAPTRTADVLLKEPVRFAMPDVRLRPEPLVTVRVDFPPREDRDDLEDAQLVAGEIRDPRTHDFIPVHRAPLREGESTYRFSSYGLKRVWVESAAGKKLVFQTIEVKAPTSIVDFVLRRAEIRGRVTYDDKGLADALVSLADPLNGTQFLAQVPSDDDGGFRFRTWATGELDLTGKSEISVDLEIPKSGFSLSVVDAETNTPVRAQFMNRSRFPDGRAQYGWRETDAQGRFDLSGYPDGTATLHLTAKGYRSETVDIPIRSDRPETTIRLHRAKPSAVRVVDLSGAAIRNASVVGGFENEHEDPFHAGTTDANGRVEFDPPPPAGTLFYVAASGHALGMIASEPEREVTIVLHPPSKSILTLRQNDGPPEKVFLVMAAPAGRGFIPFTAIEELAEANGMNLYQISGSSPTGDVVLPEFLGPGTYDLFLARRGGKPFIYERIGTIRTPLPRSSVLAVKTR